MRILIVNGPNLGRLGTRQPEIYGATTLDELERNLEARAEALGAQVVCKQSDDEQTVVTLVRDADADAVILNAASMTHHSFALRDAVAACAAPVYEVHISNIYAREPYRRHSLLSSVARGTIVGLGVHGYLLALEAAVAAGREANGT